MPSQQYLIKILIDKFQEYTPRSREDSVASGRSDSIASRRGMTPGDEAIFNKSMGDLASKLMGASRGHLAHKPVRGSVDNVSHFYLHLIIAFQ